MKKIKKFKNRSISKIKRVIVFTTFLLPCQSLSRGMDWIRLFCYFKVDVPMDVPTNVMRTTRCHSPRYQNSWRKRVPCTADRRSWWYVAWNGSYLWWKRVLLGRCDPIPHGMKVNLTTLEGRIVLACIPAKVRKESEIIYHVMVSGILFGRPRNKALCPVLGE